MKGTWKGFYRYDNKEIQKSLGFDRTDFTIEITSFDKLNFEGNVNDDISTGGMKETGKIKGHLKGDKVYFQKFMPIGSLIDTNGNHSYTGKKHKTLYYSGTLSKDKQEIKGNWKFKYTTAFIFGFIPFPYRPGSGTWSMKIC